MKPFFSKTTQFGLVVKDLDAVMANYVKYGIGPWSVYEFNDSNVDDMFIAGKPVQHSMKLALTYIGQTMWELIQPLDDRSDYTRFLKEHGEGIHHVAVAVDNVDAYYAFCADKGLKPVQSGKWKDESGRLFVYDYRDTRDELKVIVELHAPDAAFEMPKPLYEFPNGPMPCKPVFTDVLQVGIICKDLHGTVKSYTDKYGIGPWDEYRFDSTTVADLSIGGKPTEYAMDLALTQVGTVQWELIQPLDQLSDYARFLREHGEGIHHVALATSMDYKEMAAFCDKNGIKQVQYGHWGRNFHYDYRDLRDELKCIVELYGPAPDFTWPKPVAVHKVAA
ncbi:MAG: VOC family protein [Desulfovibrio sp.]|jgi:hypothetical protein|nr:VOC family protein [Desulfovibrio sp.]